MVAYEGTNFTDFGVDFLLQELPVFALFFRVVLGLAPSAFFQEAARKESRK